MATHMRHFWDVITKIAERGPAQFARGLGIKDGWHGERNHLEDVPPGYEANYEMGFKDGPWMMQAMLKRVRELAINDAKTGQNRLAEVPKWPDVVELLDPTNDKINQLGLDEIRKTYDDALRKGR